ncbi:MAG: hypothetical protein ACYDBB_03305 [Armatimonadota bacterium]
MRYQLFGLGLLLVCVFCAPPLPAVPDWPEWDVIRHDDPALALLDATGPELRWSAVEQQGTTRLFLSDHPEGIGMITDRNNPEASRWPRAEGTLWADQAEGAGEVNYRVFISHQNWHAKPIYIGLLVENLAPKGEFTVTGDNVTTVAALAADSITGWANMKNLGKRNAYAELSGRLFSPLPTVQVAQGAGATTLISWKIPPGATLGVRAHVRIAGAGAVKCRLSTAWAWGEEGLAKHPDLIPLNGPHPRGSWPTSEVLVSNKEDVFDLALNEKDGATVRWLRLCQPVYDAAGKKSGYRPDVVYVAALSYNPTQAKMNNGMYGARTNVALHVKNSGATAERVGVYLRYPDKRLEGAYVGAATVYAYDEQKKAWTPKETRAVDLSRLTYTNRATGETARRDWWFATKCLATYAVPPGESLSIPLTITSDFPAMLPLGIVLRKEPHTP